MHWSRGTRAQSHDGADQRRLGTLGSVGATPRTTAGTTETKRLKSLGITAKTVVSLVCLKMSFSFYTVAVDPVPRPRHTAARLLRPRGRKNEKTFLTPHANRVGAYAQQLRTGILGAFFAAIGPARLTRNNDKEDRSSLPGHAGAKSVFFLFDCLKLRRALALAMCSTVFHSSIRVRGSLPLL